TVPRPGDAILVRIFHRPRESTRAGPARQAGDDLSQVAASAGRANARHRLRLGRTDLLCGAEVRRASAWRDAFTDAARFRQGEDTPAGAGRAGPSRAPRLCDAEWQI